MNRRGFTLLEALIAIVLVAVVLPVGIAGISGAAHAAGQVRRNDLARRLAEGKLNQLVVTGEWQTSATSGDFDPATDGDDAAGFHWQLTSTAWRDPTVHDLRLAVTWDPVSDAHTVAVETLATPPATASTTTTTGTTP